MADFFPGFERRRIACGAELAPPQAAKHEVWRGTESIPPSQCGGGGGNGRDRFLPVRSFGNRPGRRQLQHADGLRFPLRFGICHRRRGWLDRVGLDFALLLEQLVDDVPDFLKGFLQFRK